MGRGKRLTNEELAVIKAYKDTGLFNREIAKNIKRSPKVVNNYFKIGVNYGAYKEVVANVKLIIVLNELLYVVLLLSTWLHLKFLLIYNYLFLFNV